MVTCETVEITMREEGGAVTIVTVPAYTVGLNALKNRVDEIWEQYAARSTATCNPVSLGDFALYLISEATHDPRTMGEEDGNA